MQPHCAIVCLISYKVRKLWIYFCGASFSLNPMWPNPMINVKLYLRIVKKKIPIINELHLLIGSFCEKRMVMWGWFFIYFLTPHFQTYPKFFFAIFQFCLKSSCGVKWESFQFKLYAHPKLYFKKRTPLALLCGWNDILLKYWRMHIIWFYRKTQNTNSIHTLIL